MGKDLTIEEARELVSKRWLSVTEYSPDDTEKHYILTPKQKLKPLEDAESVRETSSLVGGGRLRITGKGGQVWVADLCNLEFDSILLYPEHPSVSTGELNPELFLELEPPLDRSYYKGQRLPDGRGLRVNAFNDGHAKRIFREWCGCFPDNPTDAWGDVLTRQVVTVDGWNVVDRQVIDCWKY